MAELVIPNTIANGNSADGNEVGANFSAIESWADDIQVEIDAVIDDVAGLGTPSISSTANTVMKRDAAGRSKVASPAALSDIANKSYVDSTVDGITTVVDAVRFYRIGNVVFARGTLTTSGVTIPEEYRPVVTTITAPAVILFAPDAVSATLVTASSSGQLTSPSINGGGSIYLNLWWNASDL